MSDNKIEFSDKILLEDKDFPKVAFQNGAEFKLVDGSSLIEYDDYHKHQLTNGVIRIYEKDDDEYRLVFEKLPDGRARAYDENSKIFYECDEKGNYHLDKPETDDEYGTIEDGTSDGWIKRQNYGADESFDEKTNDIKPSLKAEFSDKLVFSEDDLPIMLYNIYQDGQVKERILADGSVMVALDDDYYEHRLNNGVIRIICEEVYGEKYRLLYEKLPNGRARAYDEEENAIYECDENGNYHLDKPETYDDYRIVEEGNKTGWLKRQIYRDDETTDETSDLNNRYSAAVFSDKLYFEKEDFAEEVYHIADVRKLADSSLLISRDDYYEHRLPNGVVRIYEKDDEEYHLVFEKLPDGRARAYDEDDKIFYERDENGNYHLNKPETYDEYGIVEDGTSDGWMKRQTYEDDELLEDKTNDVKPSLKAEFSDKLVLSEDDLPTVILEIDGEKWYADGSVYKDDFYQQKLPNGTVRLYEKDYDDEYHLVYEELPDGRVRVYDTEGEVLFEKDENGNYHLDNPETDDDYRIVEDGNQKGWIKRQIYRDKDILVKDNTDDEHYVIKDADDHVLEEGNKYVYKKYFINGDVQEEKTESGDIFTYNEKHFKIGEKLADGTCREWYDNGRKKMEKLADGTYYEWFANGRKKVERLANGKERRWYEDPYVLSFEKDDSGRYKKYDQESRVIEEFDGSHKVRYAYYGRTHMYSHIHHYDLYDDGQRFAEDRDKYEHYNERGEEDTDKYLAIKLAADCRVSDDDAVEEHKKIKRVLTKISRATKISKIKKSIDMYRASKQVQKTRKNLRYRIWPSLSDKNK